MTHPKPSITVKVDVANPGQFFACCGLLELADRLWPGTEGWFDRVGQHFHICVNSAPESEALRDFYDAFANAVVKNTMTAAEVQRREELATMSKKQRNEENLENEKKSLDKLWRESPVLIGRPFDVRIDWFLDNLSGGSALKTWAGQQSVIDIANAMMKSACSANCASQVSKHWFSEHSDSKNIPFNFDATLGGQGSDLDVGFSRDPLDIPTATRPFIELLAFVGLQRFRPSYDMERKRYRYSIWLYPACPQLASVITSGVMLYEESRTFEFKLLYRTKYLKAFLPATPIGGSI